MKLMVKASIPSVAGPSARTKRSVTPGEAKLWIALSEIITAALCTERLRFAPGDIKLTFEYPFEPHFGNDIVVVIEDYNSSDSASELEDRENSIERYLTILIPDATFDVRIRPSGFARSTDADDSVFKHDMSPEAAFIRASDKMKYIT